MAKRKSWRDKRDASPEPHVVPLPKPWMGKPAGALMLIASPRLVRAYVEAIARGATRSVVEMRTALADRNGAAFCCPITAGMFVRIVAEAALEEMEAGAPAEAVTPFWRLVAPDSDAAKKLSCGTAFVRRMRASEAELVS